MKPRKIPHLTRLLMTTKHVRLWT